MMPRHAITGTGHPEFGDKAEIVVPTVVVNCPLILIKTPPRDRVRWRGSKT
jgi:hypothetical protein